MHVLLANLINGHLIFCRGTTGNAVQHMSTKNFFKFCQLVGLLPPPPPPPGKSGRVVCPLPLCVEPFQIYSPLISEV